MNYNYTHYTAPTLDSDKRVGCKKAQSPKFAKGEERPKVETRAD